MDMAKRLERAAGTTFPDNSRAIRS